MSLLHANRRARAVVIGAAAMRKAGWLAQSEPSSAAHVTVPADIPCRPIYERHFEPGQLQFITTSTYRRSQLFTCQRFCRIFVETVRQPR
jgi:hypothetical protein